MHPLLQRHMIIWTIVLVLALGAIVGGLMLKPPLAENELTHSPAFSRLQKLRLAKANGQSSSLPSPGPRIPASSTPPAFFGEPAQQVLDFQIDCRDANHLRLKKETAQIRLRGIACASSDEIVSSEIRNEANGFSATVFMADARTFTTDYISLKRGENRIRVLHHLKSGTREDLEVLAHRE